MISINIEYDSDTLAGFCQRWNITELAFFGSVLTDDFSPDSDVDVMVSFAPDSQLSWSQWLDMREELRQVFGRPVDVVERRNVESSPNPFRRRHILSSAKQAYVA